MGLEFSKLSGTGNDFIIFNNLNGKFDKYKSDIEFIKKISARGLSVGADGVIFIEKSEKADFKWLFYNSDGSIAEMCGNGSRCAARFAFMNNIAPKKMSFETLAGIIEAEVFDNNEVKTLLTTPHSISLNEELLADDMPLKYSFANTGVPHFVAEVADLDNFDVFKYGKLIRYHEKFSPKGTNANFIKVIDKKSIQIRTYERGVENETLACGTGSAAAALLSIKNGKTESPTNVITKSGKVLKIFFEEAANKLYLQGEARLVYSGTLEEEAFIY